MGLIKPGQFITNPKLKKIIGNISWLAIDKLFRLGVGLIVGVWVARYLGPKEYGIYNYAIAFSALFSAISSFGIDSLVIRDLVKFPDKINEILGTAFLIKIFGGFLAFFLSILAAVFINKDDWVVFYLVLFSSLGFVFQSVLTIDLFFQSEVLSKYTVFAQNIAFIIVSLCKVTFILLKLPLLYFGFAGFLEIILGSFFLVFFYNRNNKSVTMWKFNSFFAIEFIKNSWPLILSGITIMLYMRIDQIMIGKILGSEQVGIYSAAIRMSEIWYFIPMIISTSVFPSIIEAKKTSESCYYERIQKLFKYMLLLSISIAIPMTFLSNYLVNLVYRHSYIQAGPILSIHIWSGVFVSLGVASSNWYLVEKLQKLSFYRTLTGACINIILNLFLIPQIGISGAALSTVIAQSFTGYFFDFTTKGTRKIFYMKTKAFFLFNFTKG